MNDFDPINRLIEFGLNAAFAQQMILQMNSAMQNMQIPGQNLQQTTSKEWYIAREGKATGPYYEREIKSLLLNNQLTKEDLIWCTGMAKWDKLINVPEILNMIIQLPPRL